MRMRMKKGQEVAGDRLAAPVGATMDEGSLEVEEDRAVPKLEGDEEGRVQVESLAQD